MRINLIATPPQSTVDRAIRDLRWPSAEVMFAGAWRPDWRRRLKYLARMALTIEARARVLDVCATDDFARALLRVQPRAFYPLMSHLLDRRFGVEDRLNATLASLAVIPARLRGDGMALLASEGLPLLVLDDGTRLNLSISGVSFHEGLWQLGLHTPTGVRLYSLGFGLPSPRSLLVANVQGASIGIDGLEKNRLLTHTAHGMRPPYLLLHALKTIARSLGIGTLSGIDPHHHVKGRWNLRRSRLQFDYRALWRDHGATREPSGNWSLPLEPTQRALETVPSKKRAMYRRRHELLQRFDESIAGLFA